MKRVKMLLYGEPGVGKSVFASKAPKPFFITTDGNYEWLEDFGAKPEAHRQVFSWSEAKEAFAQAYEEYETIVVDLLEDMFKWCEYDYCTRAKLEHVSDVGYGKGYDITRNEFFLEISKLLGKNKHIILITHGTTWTTKDRRGVEHTKHGPSNRIPDKVLDMIEGRLRYCLRCYMKAEEQNDGTILKKRYLSVVPKENEFGIARGLDEDKVPHDIDLDFDEFARVIGLNSSSLKDVEELKTSKPSQNFADNIKDVVHSAKLKIEPAQKTTEVNNVDKTTTVEEKEQIQQENFVIDESVEEKNQATNDLPWKESNQEENKEVEKSTQTEQIEKPAMTQAEKIAAIRAKIAAVNASNKK